MRSLSDIQLIVAVDEVGGFAKNGEIPWSFKEDWEHFKRTTANSICIMGRKTYEDILDRKPANSKSPSLLAGRSSYVITSNTNPQDFVGVDGIATSLQRVVDSLPEDERNIFILGGEKLYIQAITWASRAVVTVVPGTYNCDRKFPINYLQQKFIIASGEENNGLKFINYHRKFK